MKKKSSVIAKLIIPVAVLGCIAIMIAGVSLYSMTAVQKESNQISGEGVRATICMDEINLAFANTQKLTLALCAEPSKDLYEYVASQLTEYQSNVDSYEKELLAMDHYFTADDIPVSYTHLRAHETGRNLVCRLLLEKKKTRNRMPSSA